MLNARCVIVAAVLSQHSLQSCCPPRSSSREVRIRVPVFFLCFFLFFFPVVYFSMGILPQKGSKRALLGDRATFAKSGLTEEHTWVACPLYPSQDAKLHLLLLGCHAYAARQSAIRSAARGQEFQEPCVESIQNYYFHLLKQPFNTNKGKSNIFSSKWTTTNVLGRVIHPVSTHCGATGQLSLALATSTS